jgi:hypothetical protein
MTAHCPKLDEFKKLYTSQGGAGGTNHNNKSSLLLSFKKEDSSFLKKRSKRLLTPVRQLHLAFPVRAMIASVAARLTFAVLGPIASASGDFQFHRRRIRAL